jgi:queuosine precursor transporter
VPPAVAIVVAVSASSSATDRAEPVHFARDVRGNYDLIVAAFVGMLLISNVGATKAIAFGSGIPLIGSVITDGGAFLFPLTYVFGDVLAEVYGMAKARRAIILGFVLEAIASLVFLIVSITPPAPGWPNQEAWQAVLGFFPRIVIASLAGYLAGQFLNAYVLVKIKERTKEGTLWARLVGSTVVGELADTVIFCVIAFGGILSTANLVNYTVTGYLYKCLVEIACLPITYRVIRAIKKREPSYGAPVVAEHAVGGTG